jgi:hypothetical protein
MVAAGIGVGEALLHFISARVLLLKGEALRRKRQEGGEGGQVRSSSHTTSFLEI